MSRHALVFEGVTKRYGRQARPALDGLDLHVPRGCIAGLVGPNGAGKTTAFSVVSGFLLPDAGRVDILDGGPFDADRLKGLLGVLPQDAALPDRHTPRELLVHLCRLQGMSAAVARREADRVLEVVRLSDRARDRIGTLSHGMRRRVAVATAMAGQPPLVLLDEPLAGLDPGQASSLRDALAATGSAQTLVVSSHNLVELERLCDWVVFLADGRLVREGTVAALTGRTEVVRWVLGPGPDPVDELRTRLPGHGVDHVDGALEVRVPPDGDLDAANLTVMEILVRDRVPVREVQRGVGLERRFMAETSGP